VTTLAEVKATKQHHPSLDKTWISQWCISGGRGETPDEIYYKTTTLHFSRAHVPCSKRNL